MEMIRVALIIIRVVMYKRFLPIMHGMFGSQRFTRSYAGDVEVIVLRIWLGIRIR